MKVKSDIDKKLKVLEEKLCLQHGQQDPSRQERLMLLRLHKERLPLPSTWCIGGSEHECDCA